MKRRSEKWVADAIAISELPPPTFQKPR